MYKGQIPIGPRWNGEGIEVPNYAQGWHVDKNFEWFDNLSFEATIRITDFARGRSAANFAVIILERSVTPDFLHGATCTMFMRDLMDIIKHEGIDQGGFVTEEFCFCKRGTNYGIQLYQEAK